jgi:hypothetical protein
MANKWDSQLALLWENIEVKALIIGAHGLLPILEILEPCTVKSRQYMVLQLLKIVNAVGFGFRLVSIWLSVMLTD